MNLKYIVLPLSLFALVATAACLKKTNRSDQGGSQSGKAGETILAKINGEPITEGQVRDVAGADLMKAESELYDAQKGGIDQIIEDRLLELEAKKEGISKIELLKKEVFEKIQVADAEIKKFYDENKDRLGARSFDEVKSSIQGYLFRERQDEIHGALIAKLKKKADIEVLISVPRTKIDEGDFPAKGPKDAPIRLVEFTDYECPFCGKARPTVTKVMEEYKGKIRYVLRDFPLSFHKNSLKAHEAAHCADDQGKYWDLNQKIWENQHAITLDDLKKYAKEVKLKTKNFDECLDSGKYSKKVAESLAYGQTVGVSGTPAFFINGRMISGARPFEAFKEIIDDELNQ